MNLREFQRWALQQKAVGNPTVERSYMGECVSLIQQYLYLVYGNVFKPYGNAKDWFNSYPSNFKKILPGVKLEKGDILVYGSEFGNGFGHLGIIDSDNKFLEQNGRIKGKITQNEVPYSNYKCILRSRNVVNVGDVFKVRVDKNIAYVREQPTIKSKTVKQPSGRDYLIRGIIFNAVDLVSGEDPYSSGNNKWYKSEKGNYVWSGGLVKI